MNKKIWDLYAPIYERAMRSDRKVYQMMYDRIPKVIQEKDVLEIATGPGLLAKHVAYAANKMIATDYSEGMIAEAQKGKYPANLTFEVVDAADLPFDDKSFDVVLIANALHVMPNPEKALIEIERVLKDFEHQWNAEEYRQFLEKNGWKVKNWKAMQARIPIVYVECVRGR